MSVVSVYAVFADQAEAERIGRAMVEQRRAACVNILGPCQSIYRWNDHVQVDEEVTAIFKTTAARVNALLTAIAALHSYDVPCVTVSPVDKLLSGYAAWVEQSVD